MKLRKISNSILRKLNINNIKITVVRNHWDIFKFVNKNYCPHWSLEQVYNYYCVVVGDNKDTRHYILNKYKYRYINTNQIVYGICSFKTDEIILNKILEKQSKQYIKFVILHEIGPHLTGYSETEADNFAEEWMKKI